MRISLLLFLSGFLLFIFFSALTAVANTSKTMLNNSCESGHPCLVPDFRGNVFNFSPLGIMFAVGLSYIAFIMLRYVPSIPAALFIIARTWKQPRCSSGDEWVRKLWHIYTWNITQPLKRIHLNQS